MKICGSLKRSYFTMIELLVVIAIIGILAGLIGAGVTRAVETAREAEARTVAQQIKVGLDSYYTEYQNFPGAWSALNSDLKDVEFNDAIYDVLTGNNPRSINFVRGVEKLENSWGNPYLVAIDGDFDNMIETRCNKGGDSETKDVKDRFSVYSLNKDEDDYLSTHNY